MGFKYKPKYFQIYELVPPEEYALVPHHILWMCWNWEVPWTADQLREIYGPATVNDWYFGGRLKYRGWRPQKPPPGENWAEWTQHAWWNALDMNFKNADPEEIRQDIIANKYPEAFQYIRCIEANVPWLHMDCRNYDGLLVVVP